MKSNTKQEVPGIVQDYIKYLRLINVSKNPETRMRNRDKANRTLNVMTAKAANLAVKMAKKQDLLKGLLIGLGGL